MNELISIGSDEIQIKSLGDGTVQVEGYLVLYGSPDEPDFHGDYFAPDTDYDLEPDGTKSVSVFWNHGQDPEIGKHKLGGQKALVTKKERGLWIEARLKESDKYDSLVLELIQERKRQGKRNIGWSSGSPSHLVTRKNVSDGASKITFWSLSEASLTHIPADARNTIDIKSFNSLLSENNTDELQGTPKDFKSKGVATSDAVDSVDINSHISIIGAKQHMSTEQNIPEVPENKNELKGLIDNAVQEMNNDFNAKFAGLTDAINQVTQYIQDNPKVRKSGYISETGGNSDANVKSLGDFLIAVKNGDAERITRVYGSTKAQDSTTGASGGYLIPSGFYNDLIQVVMENSEVYQRVTRIPVLHASGDIPALDMFTAPVNSGDTPEAGGMVASNRGEGGSYTETDANFELLSYRTHDNASGYFKVSREMLSDVMGIEALLKNIIRVAVQGKLEYMILNGSQPTEMTGILNSTARLNVTPDTDNTFSYTDASNMVSKFQSITGAGSWVLHPSVLPDVYGMSLASSATWVANIQSKQANSLLGYEIITSKFLPVANSSGSAMLADLGAYYVFERGGMEIEYSSDAFFTTGYGAYRFSMRTDGKPALSNVITHQNSYQYSPFVVHND